MEVFASEESTGAEEQFRASVQSESAASWQTPPAEAAAPAQDESRIPLLFQESWLPAAVEGGARTAGKLLCLLSDPRQQAVLRIRAEVEKAVRDFLDNNGYVLVDTPILTPAACEGTSTLFETDYFGTPAFLAQSGQLYNEANIFAFGKVYCFGPTFRAEKSKTRRHLMEFWMVEPEAAWMELPGLLDEQNLHRAALKLPPLPDLTGLTHDRPVIASAP